MGVGASGWFREGGPSSGNALPGRGPRAGWRWWEDHTPAEWERVKLFQAAGWDFPTATDWWVLLGKVAGVRGNRADTGSAPTNVRDQVLSRCWRGGV